MEEAPEEVWPSHWLQTAAALEEEHSRPAGARAADLEEVRSCFVADVKEEVQEEARSSCSVGHVKGEVLVEEHTVFSDLTREEDRTEVRS